LYLYLPFFAISQQGNAVISNVFHGSVIGIGWGDGATSGSITESIYFDCSSCADIGNVYLLSMGYGIDDSLMNISESYVTINGIGATYSSETSVGEFLIGGITVYKCHLLKYD